jgi:hypothetical protein
MTEREWERAWTDGIDPPCERAPDDGIHQQALVGLARLERYLSKWAAFRQWEVSH